LRWRVIFGRGPQNLKSASRARRKVKIPAAQSSCFFNELCQKNQLLCAAGI
jgi:hypothetical protein